jgi:hypothetical protein
VRVTNPGRGKRLLIALTASQAVFVSREFV